MNNIPRRWERCAPQVRNTPIIITLPYVCSNEAEAIGALFAAGAEMIHLRKPEATADELRGLMGTISTSLMPGVSVHYNEAAAREFSAGGFHAFINSACAGDCSGGMRQSLSAHTFAEMETSQGKVDYLFISPIFNSISKQGYAGRWTCGEIEAELAKGFSCGIVALGGIDATNIANVRDMGFDGAALLGSVWVVKERVIDIEATVWRYQNIVRAWRAAPRLQFISDGDEAVAEKFLAGGGRWVQLRMKDASKDEIVARGLRFKEMCRKYGATFIINDDPEVASRVGSHGVHLGRNDMSPASAREILGLGAVIGGTANTFADVARLVAQGVDYVGLGPYRFTTTKKNLSPVLGLEGYADILRECAREGIKVPVFAIGGIVGDDIRPLLECGVRGIAMSGGVACADDPEAATRGMVDKLNF